MGASSLRNGPTVRTTNCELSSPLGDFMFTLMQEEVVVMIFSSLLEYVETPLILDTSVLINLQSCLRGPFILRSINNEAFATSDVFNEIDDESSNHELTKVFVKEMRELKLVHELSLTVKEQEFSDRLSLRRGINLGVGEASTIAVALSRGYTAVIDEKRGRRIGSNELEGKMIGRTFDMLVHPQVQSRINAEELRSIVLCALQFGGMSIEKNDAKKLSIL